MKAIDETSDSEFEDVVIPVGEGDEAVSPITGGEWRAAGSAAALAFVLTIASAYFGGRGMLAHTPKVSMRILAALIPLAVAVWMYSGWSLKITRPHEGTVARGLALAATVLSSLCILLVSWAEYSLVSVQAGR